MPRASKATEEPIRPFPSLALGQRHADAFLSAARASGDRVPSLLFTGPEGTGKEYAAIDLARRLCCERAQPCDPRGDLCPSCRMVSHLEHPGIHLIYPTPTQGANEGDEGDVSDVARVLDEKRRDLFARPQFPKKVSIRIARARAVIQRANTKPFDSPLNVFIFVDAHAMREEAQNALLKVVEEPPPHSVLIFLTTNPDAILDTIRSRCQRIRFTPLAAAAVGRVLVDYYGAEEGVARRAAALSQGSITRAKAVADSFDDDQRRLAAAFVAGISRETASWAIGRALVLGRGSNREGVARFLDEVALVFRDVMAREPDLYVNRELADEIGRVGRAWEPRALPGVIGRIAQARNGILLGNLNVDSTLTDLFLDIRSRRT